MTTAEAFPRFSVVVASRGRPNHLRRALRAIRQLDYPAFEIVVVGNEETLSVGRERAADGLKCVHSEQANLSIARNLGTIRSSGQFCAFIDDDAVPEPMWLYHHAVGLRETEAEASVGYVRGPDGIRFQSRFETIGMDGISTDVPVDGERAFVPEPKLSRAVKLVGTNTVVRRDVLLRLGGFDSAYRYFLEDGDLSVRLRAGGYRVAVVPLAEVHHALAASAQRNAERGARTLFDIGRSTAIFMRRHSDDDLEQAYAATARRERRRLIGAMVRGLLEPRDVSRLMGTLRDGWHEGAHLALPPLRALVEAFGEGFTPVSAVPSGHHVIACRLPRRAAAIAEARDAVAGGAGRASVFCLSLTGLPHSVRYTEGGVWVQTGGQFVPHGTARGRFRWCRFADRIEDEKRRVAKRRGLTESTSVSGEGSP